MFTQTAEIYDLIYGPLKDYEGECQQLVERLGRIAPGARTVLDVACGTGEHVRILSERHGLEVDGLDLDERLLAVARRKNPARTFFQADMTSFELGRVYDVVLCLFSSIGYARTLDGVTAALSCFGRHLAPGGRVLVEPWFAPEEWRVGRVDVQGGEADGVKVTRMGHSSVRGRLSLLTLDYLIGTDSGVEHRREVHEVGLFTPAEMLACFDQAGLSAEHEPGGLSGRGLYVAAAAR